MQSVIGSPLLISFFANRGPLPIMYPPSAITTVNLSYGNPNFSRSS